MPILIKSFNGQRSCALQNNGAQRQVDILDDIINALKGLTFKFEVKIADVVATAPRSEYEDMGDKMPTPVQVNQPQPPNDGGDSQKKESIAQNPSMQTDQIIRHDRKIVDPLKVVEKLKQLDPSRCSDQSELCSYEPRGIGLTSAHDHDILNQSRGLEESQFYQKPRVSQQPRMAEPPVVFEEPKVIEQARMVEHHRIPEQPRIVETPMVVEPANVTESGVEKLRQDLPILTANRKQQVPKIIKGSLPIGAVIEKCCIAVDSEADPPMAYIAYDDTKIMEVVDFIAKVKNEIEKLPMVASVDVGDIVFAKSNDDDNWYRSCIESIEGDEISIFFFDWGLRETLSINRIKYLQIAELGLAQFPACALKIHFSNNSRRLIDEVMKCESAYHMQVDSYDDSSKSYNVTVLMSGP